MIKVFGYMLLKHFALNVALLLSVQGALAQQGFPPSYGPQPEIGKRMPDFTLNNVRNYTKDQVSLSDFRDRWLFIDFWFSGCSACIKSFPKINRLQATFRDKVQFLLIGINEQKFFYGRDIESMYERLAIKQNLDLAAAFDSTLMFKWGIRSLPHIIIVDPDGIVRSITNGQDLNSDKIGELISGKETSFFLKDADRSTFNPGGEIAVTSLIYRSVLTKWTGEKQQVPVLGHYLKYVSNHRPEYQITMVPLHKIYNVAYTGSAHWDRADSLYNEFYPRPVLETTDTVNFEYSYETYTGLFNFSISCNDSGDPRRRLMEAMQQQLEVIFGYKARVEKRAMFVWKLVALPGADRKLKTKGGTPRSNASVLGFSISNLKVKSILDFISNYLENDQVPIFDETGIDSGIDINIEALMTDYEEVRRALRSYNLDLILGERAMFVIVISDY